MTSDKSGIKELLPLMATEPAKPWPTPTPAEIRDDLARSCGPSGAHQLAARNVAREFGLPWSPAMARDLAGCAPGTFSPKFKTLTGVTPVADPSSIHASMLDRAVARVLEFGIPAEQLWLEYDAGEQQTRVMMGPEGRDSDPDLRSCAALVWITMGCDWACSADERDSTVFVIVSLAPELARNDHGMATGDGPIAWPDPVPPGTPAVDYWVSAVNETGFTLATTDPSPRTAATPRAKTPSKRCQRCNAIVSPGSSRCYRCGGKRIA